MSNCKEYIKKMSCIILTVIFIALPIYNLFSEGKIFFWHIGQKNFYLSGLQCIIWIAITCLCVYAKKMHAHTIVFGSALLFMSMQGIIIPYIAVYVYFEMICYIGFTINNRTIKKDDLIYNFIMGLSIWGCSAIVCSLLKHGTITDLRLMSVCLVIIAFFFTKDKYIFMPVRLSRFINKNKDNPVNILLIVSLIILSLILAAKTNSNYDYDSLWYLLQPEHMLVGEHSFYDYLGYSAFVFYYPKLVELFVLPLAALGDYSFILIATVFIYNLFIVAIYKAISYLCVGMKEHTKLLFIMVLFTMPSLTGVASSAKGDIFGGFFVFVSLYFFIQFVDENKIYNLIYSIIALFLCTGTKLTYLLWGGIIGLLFVTYVVYWIIKKRNIVKICDIINKHNLILSCSGVLFIGGIHYRTYKLTGYPIYPIMVDFWNKIGFKANDFMKTEADSILYITADQMINRVYEFLFAPSSLSHTVMCWPTNLVFIFVVMALLFAVTKRKKYNTNSKILICASLLEMIVAIYYALVRVKPDGNYFYFPFLLTAFTCFYILYLKNDVSYNIVNSKFMSFVLSLMLILTIPLTFVANWGWASGIPPFSNKIVVENFHDREVSEDFVAKGYYNIAKYIDQDFESQRVIVSGDELNLKGAVETYASVFSGASSSGKNTESYEAFKEYVQMANIVGFVVTADDDSVFNEYVSRLITEVNCINIIYDEKATMYIVDYS